MDRDEMKLLPSVLSGSLKPLGDTKLSKMLDERISMTEAMALTTKIIASYPTADKVGDGYVGAIADTLMSFPASVARQCGDPKQGIIRWCKFLPSVAEIVNFCESFTEPLRRRWDRERRYDQQIKEREEFQKRQEDRAKRLSIKELKEKYGDWNNNWKPIPGAEHKYKPPAVDPNKPKPGSYADMVAKHGRPLGRFETPGDKWNRGIRDIPDKPNPNNDPFAGLE